MNKRFKKINLRSIFVENWIVLVVVIIMIFTIISATKIIANEIGSKNQDTILVEQDNIYISIEEYDTLNPVVSKSKDVFYFDKILYRSLFVIGSNMTPYVDLTKVYYVDTKAGKITIELKDDIQFMNGQKFTAKDVIFSINVIKLCEESYYFDMVNKIESCTAVDSKTVMIKFKDPNNCNLFDLTFPILPSGSYKSTYDFINNNSSDFVPCGISNYSYSKNDINGITLTSKDGGKTIICNILPNGSNEMNLALINEITAYETSNSMDISKATNKNLKSYEFASNEVEFIQLNPENEWLKDIEFRKAILYAINDDDILSNAYMDTGIRSNSIILNGFMDVYTRENTYSYDKVKAKEILANLGLYDKNGDKFLEDAEGSRVELTIILQSGNNIRMLAAKSIKTYLEQIGIYSTIISCEGDEYTEAIKSKDYSLLITGYCFGMSLDLNDFFNGEAPYYYFNKEIYNEAIKLTQLHTYDEYHAIVKSLVDIINESSIYYPIYYKTFSLITNEHFTMSGGVSISNIYANIASWKWYLEEDK